MRARGLTKTNHSTAQLATTGLTDNDIDALWKLRYRVKTWALAGTLAFNHASVPDQSVSFTGTLTNQYSDELDCTIQSGVVLTVASPVIFTGDVTSPPTPFGTGDMTIGDVAILRPEYTVVPPSTRAQASLEVEIYLYMELLPNGVFVPEYGMYLQTVPGDSPVGTPFTGTLNGRNVQLYNRVILRGDPGTTIITPTLTLTPATYWPYSDGTTPVWNAATGAQLAPTFQVPM